MNWNLSCGLVSAAILLAGCTSALEAINSSESFASTAPGPSFSISSHVDNATVAGVESVTGTCQSDSTITISGAISGSSKVVSCTGGTFSVPVQLAGTQGTKSLTLKSEWSAGGNATTKTLQLKNPVPAMHGINLFSPCGNYYGQYYQTVNDKLKLAWDLEYYKSRGQTLMRVGFAWEVIQPTLNGALTTWHKACLHDLLDQADARSMKVIIDLHNYGRYIVSNNGGAKPDDGTATLGD
ncbi:MAG: hypothetical protein EOP20_02865, partial [Hyphomicrobiales bacterium]